MRLSGCDTPHTAIDDKKFGHNALARRLWQALESCEVIKVEEEQRLSALGDTIFEMRSQQSSRDVRRADAAARATPRPQGPLQMSGGSRDHSLKPQPQHIVQRSAAALDSYIVCLWAM